MFNKEDLQTVFMSILLTGVIVLALGLVACQDSVKKAVEDSTEFRDADIQRIELEKGELLSKAVCTDNSQTYTVLTNIKNPLKIDSLDKSFYTSYVLKIYLLPDKTYSGSVTTKTFETASNSPVREAKVQSLKGIWIEKKALLELVGLGKIRKVKQAVPNSEAKENETKDEKIAPKFVDKVELMISSLAQQSRLNKKITVLTSEPAQEGPDGQKLSEICAPVQ